ncbi:deoxyribodipyrimidine photo-lyase [Rhodovulum sp. 12E13]|uniref:cryptochrome/photolyase family protein n=1 Tax=Rhodovulum sp. 12E13 TaxID=2203891 RepID=UPI000E179481|nr:deoxyribodipyrimidine photo-lyase [Rhodovulum sp. 12E13]RDC73427.1 deoxyribodipyrimidine photo-lyase [Rhodovulum sp. 12E13]
MRDKAPAIWWIRRDLRLTDNPALTGALSGGGPVIPVFVRDGAVEGLRTAPAWRLGEGLAALSRALEEKGSRLVLRSGDAREALRAVAAETGARAIHWNRLYDAQSVERDTRVKAALKEDGLAPESHGGHLLFEPWTVETKSGGMYRVYTPMWRAVKDREVPAPDAAPARLPSPETWPASETLADWRLGAGMRRGAEVVRRHILVGERAAQGRLGHFMAEIVDGYAESRDRVAEDGTSRLSAHLSLGEIGPRTCWHAGTAARDEGKRGAETFLQELVWREFAYHLLYHTPRLATGNWREEWDAFPWNEDRTDAVIAWQRGRTGLAFVDAAMREMYVTGTMHNRARMIVASVLTKHLLTHWKIGLDWFEEHLVDWDPASNALGWQWSAGSGPDATPYFRVFNPVTQLDKFDRDRAYTGRWIAEGQARPAPEALDYFEAIPPAWGLSPDDPYPAPVVDAREGRARALAAYENRSF